MEEIWVENQTGYKNYLGYKLIWYFDEFDELIYDAVQIVYNRNNTYSYLQNEDYNDMDIIYGKSNYYYKSNPIYTNINCSGDPVSWAYGGYDIKQYKEEENTYNYPSYRSNPGYIYNNTIYANPSEKYFFKDYMNYPMQILNKKDFACNYEAFINGKWNGKIQEPSSSLYDFSSKSCSIKLSLNENNEVRIKELGSKCVYIGKLYENGLIKAHKDNCGCEYYDGFVGTIKQINQETVFKGYLYRNRQNTSSNSEELIEIAMPDNKFTFTKQ